MTHAFAHGFEPTPDPRDDCGVDGKLPPLPLPEDSTIFVSRDRDLRELTFRKQDLELPILDHERHLAREIIEYIFRAAVNRTELLVMAKELDEFYGR
jgi:hypothetical protein